jgi:hypothetical protein
MANPIIEAIKSGAAPKQARLAAARGILPLAQEELLEALVVLQQDPEEDIRKAALETFNGVDIKTLIPISQNPKSPLDLLRFLAVWSNSSAKILEAIILNPSTPDEAIANLASRPIDGLLLETLTINQQRLIRHPAIIDAILANPHRSPEAERRAKEIKTEFFEKEFGAKVIAEEQKARARLSEALGVEVTEAEFQNVLAQFEVETGINLEQETVETVLDVETEFQRLHQDALTSGEEIQTEHKTALMQLASMNFKERLYTALTASKREWRMVLVRDSNRIISAAVLKNPKITESEVETVANLRGINDEVLRAIAMNRGWTSSYSIMHNLVRNPRTPLAFSMNFVNRLQMRDLKGLVKNKGVPDVLRNMASRLLVQRQ